MHFQKHENPLRSLNIGKSVLEELQEHPVCRPMNPPWEDKDIKDPRDPNLMVWINAHDQFSFSSSWCSPDDLRDWMNGTGIMVRGKTPEEKKKYWDYAVFERAGGFGSSRWLIKYTWKWFDEFVTDFNPRDFDDRGLNSQIKNPLKIKNMRTRDHHENIKRQEEVILAMYVPFVDYIVRELEYREWDNVKKEVENDLYGIKRTLCCMGVGYLGPCNTPEEILNLNWVSDIIYGKAQYLHFKKKGMELPDFEWLCSRNNYAD